MLQQVRHIVAFELSCGFGSTAFRSLCTCIKVIAVGGVITTTSHAADTIFAGNLAGVVAVQHTPYVITPLVRTADTADSIACTFYCTAGGTVLYDATIVPPADVTDIHFPGHIGIRDGDIFHGAARANAAEQTNVVLIDINVQSSDGVTVAVKRANKRTV